MTVSVVICGLVRDAERLLAKIRNYVDWREQGIVDQIIYSTWIGEIDSYNSLRKRLAEHNVEVIEIEEPRLVLKGGHQLHQMTSFFYGLSALKDDNQFVLKTRVDLADNHEAMLYDFQHGTPVVDDFTGSGLKHKILIENAQMLYPFLCGDAQFFGHIADLKKLVNFSAEMEIVFNRLAVEQTFFFEPFKALSLFRKHFYWNLPHISEIADRRDEQIAAVLTSESMLPVIQAWWLLLDEYFKVGWGEYDERVPKLSNFYEVFSFDDDIKLIGGDRSDVITSSRFVSGLVNLIGENQKLHLKKLVCNTEEDNPLDVEIKFFDDYAGFMRRFSDLPSAKASRAGDSKKIIRGAAQHFFVKDSNDEVSKRYHEQVTALRRENDFLRKELNITLTNSGVHRFLNRVLPRKSIDFFKYKLPGLTRFYARYFMKKKG